MRSFYLQCMRFFAKCQCAKCKMIRLFPWRAFFGGCEEREGRLLYAAAREKGRSGCFQSAAAGARLSWGLRGAGKPIALCSGAGKGTFRLFPERAGALNACGAFNFAAVLWKFARKSARPPDWFRGGGRKKEAG